MTAKTTDIPALILAAEGRAACKMGMAQARSRFLVRLAPEDAAALGVGGTLTLAVGASQGTVDLFYAAADGTVGGGYREISAEPSEPELQALAVSHARRKPVGAALELLRIDLERRATWFEDYAEDAGIYADGDRLCAAHEQLPDTFVFRQPDGGRTRYVYTGPNSWGVHEWDGVRGAWVGTGSAHIPDDTTVEGFVESRVD